MLLASAACGFPTGSADPTDGGPVVDGPASIDAGPPDARADADLTATCVDGDLMTGGNLVPCPLGCSDTPIAHCMEMVPSNLGSWDLLDGVTANFSVTTSVGLNSDTGEILDYGADGEPSGGDDTVLRAAGEGVISGIAFDALTVGTRTVGVFGFQSFTVSMPVNADVDLRAGVAPVVILSATTVSITGSMNGTGSGRRPGSGGYRGGDVTSDGEGCPSAGAGIGDLDDEGGGGGGSGTAGGEGGSTTGDGAACSLGGNADLLVGGSGGGGSALTFGGGGGGAIQISARQAITLNGSDNAAGSCISWISVSGGGGQTGQDNSFATASGGGGGGAGGFVLLEAPTLQLTEAVVTANGGGGGGGNDPQFANGERGHLCDAMPALGGPDEGGDGASEGNAAQNGQDRGGGDSGGGGGGGLGRIVIRTTVPVETGGHVFSPLPEQLPLHVE